MNYRSCWQYEGAQECNNSGAFYNDYYTGSLVRYSYYTPGQTYVLCLVKENG